MAVNANAILRIMGDNFDHEFITEKLSIQPKQAWKKGDKSEKYNTIKKYDCWLYETGYCKTDDINDLLKIILSTFDNKKKDLKDIVNKFRADVSLDIVIKMSDADTPALYFDKTILAFINHIGAEIDIDMYID